MNYQSSFKESKKIFRRNFIVIIGVIFSVTLILAVLIKVGFIDSYFKLNILNYSEQEYSSLIGGQDFTPDLDKDKQYVEKQVTQYLNNEKCPLPIIGYNELSDGEKNKITPSLNYILKKLSEQKQNCSDYGPELIPLLVYSEKAALPGNSNFISPLLSLDSGKELTFLAKVTSSQLITATSTPPTYFNTKANSWPSKSGTYLFYGLRLNLDQVIILARDKNISSIEILK